MKTILVRSPLLVLLLLVPLLLTLPAPAEEDAPAKRLARVLQPFVDGQTLAGAVVLVADKERVLDLSAVGFADISAHRPMTTDVLVWIASMSKPITAALLMMLVDEGKLKLD